MMPIMKIIENKRRVAGQRYPDRDAIPDK